MTRFLPGLIVSVIAFLVGVFSVLLFAAEWRHPITNQRIAVVEINEVKVIPQHCYLDIEEPQRKNQPFDPSGNYYPEVDPRSDLHVQIDLETRKKRAKRTARGQVVYRSIYYKFESVKVSEKTWIFETKNVKGVEFRFSGEFLTTGNFAESTTDWGDATKAKGTLQKYVNGEKVDEVTAFLRYYPGC